MEDCIFCKIVNGTIPAVSVYEDDEVFAFLDIKPINPGHTLVIPKKHYDNLFTMPDDALEKTMHVVRKIAIAIRKISAGVNIGMNNEKAAGQLVMHAHIHVIPRYQNDGLKHWQGKEIPSEEAQKISTKIKTLL